MSAAVLAACASALAASAAEAEPASNFTRVRSAVRRWDATVRRASAMRA
jgi:hypothetical protein